MKYVMCVGDGMADFPISELNGMTPLEYAKTPGMDSIAASGYVGRVQTVPDGLSPGSDVANMSLLGYNADAITRAVRLLKPRAWALPLRQTKPRSAAIWSPLQKAKWPTIPPATSKPPLPVN